MFCRIAYLILLVSSNLCAQQSLDSLALVLREEKISDRERAKIAVRLAWYYFQHEKYDSAIRYYNIVIEHDDRPATIASSYNGLGISFSALGLNDSAISSYDSALKLYDQLLDSTSATIVHTNLAILLKNQGRYDQSLDHAFFAVRVHERSGNIQALGSSFNTVSLVYLKMGELPLALSYGKRALELRKGIGHDKGIAKSYTNLGEVWLAMNEYDSALFCLEQAYRMKVTMKDFNSLSSTLNNLGNLYQRRNQFEKALQYYRESLSLKDESGDVQGRAVTWNNIARLEMQLHRLHDAEKSLTNASQLIYGSDMLEEMRENLEMRTDLYRLQGRYAEALATTKDLMAVKDSLLNRQKAETIAALRVDYETDKKEQEISLLNERERAQRSELAVREFQVYVLIGAVILLALLAFLIYWNLRIVREGRNRVSLLLQELHHRVKNNLQLLSSVFSLQAQYLSEPTAVLAVRSSESRVNAMALIHKKLYDGTNERSVQIREYFQELMQYLLNAYGFSENQVTVQIDVPDLRLDVDKAIPVGLIVNELVSNSFKYAFADQDSPAIGIKLRVEENTMKLEVRDNGCGFETTAKNEMKHSFGLKMVTILVRQLKGDCKIDTQSGTTYKLTLPV